MTKIVEILLENWPASFNKACVETIWAWGFYQMANYE
jgi:hypothetical protein